MGKIASSRFHGEDVYNISKIVAMSSWWNKLYKNKKSE